jgi:molybdate transport system ATP-binding protein
MNPFLEIDVQHVFSAAFGLDIRLKTQTQSLGLMGPSGSGKTSLLHAIAGIFRPSKAHIRVGEYTFSGDNKWMAPRLRRVGLVTQDALLFPHLSVVENLCFGTHADRHAETVSTVTTMLEIDHLVDRRVQYLSGGERQRVALGRALLSRPILLLADEPLCAVDIERRQRLVQRLRTFLSDQALPYIWVSHDREVIDSLCTTTANMVGGTVVLNA